MYTELYHEIVKAKEEISSMNYDQIIWEYIKRRTTDNKSLYDQAFINTVEAGLFVDTTKNGEFAMMFQLPATAAAMVHHSDGNITMYFNYPVDDAFIIRHTLTFDIVKIVEFKPQNETSLRIVKSLIGERKFNDLLNAILTVEED